MARSGKPLSLATKLKAFPFASAGLWFMGSFALATIGVLLATALDSVLLGLIGTCLTLLLVLSAWISIVPGPR